MLEDRRPPHDLDAEAAVLSSILIDPEAMAKVAGLLRPEHFYSESHRRIFEAFLGLSEVGQPTDIVTVANWLRDRDRLAQVGGAVYITETLGRAPETANVEAYAAIVERKARVRRMLLACQRVVAEAFDPNADEEAFLDRAEEAVHAVNEGAVSRGSAERMKDVLRRVFTRLQEAEASGGGPSGIPTGFDVLDTVMGGLQNGEQTLLAARPGVGKTGLMMSIARNVAVRGYGVIVFSIEMPNDQIAIRALCAQARVESSRARTSKFTPSDWSQITIAAQVISKTEHFYLFDRPTGLLELRSQVRSLQAKMRKDGVELGLVAVDYAQLLQGREGQRSREEIVSDSARGMKLLAKEIGAPVLTLSQLNREVEKRADKRPMLSDLRESGALEEAADQVIGMYRDDYYNEQSKTPGVCELLLLKNRHGPTGPVNIGFSAKSVSFYNLQTEEYPRET